MEKGRKKGKKTENTECIKNDKNIEVEIKK